jgi:hypothetical protein
VTELRTASKIAQASLSEPKAKPVIQHSTAGGPSASAKLRGGDARANHYPPVLRYRSHGALKPVGKPGSQLHREAGLALILMSRSSTTPHVGTTVGPPSSPRGATSSRSIFDTPYTTSRSHAAIEAEMPTGGDDRQAAIAAMDATTRLARGLQQRLGIPDRYELQFMCICTRVDGGE